MIGCKDLSIKTWEVAEVTDDELVAALAAASRSGPDRVDRSIW